MCNVQRCHHKCVSLTASTSVTRPQCTEHSCGCCTVVPPLHHFSSIDTSIKICMRIEASEAIAATELESACKHTALKSSTMYAPMTHSRITTTLQFSYTCCTHDYFERSHLRALVRIDTCRKKPCAAQYWPSSCLCGDALDVQNLSSLSRLAGFSQAHSRQKESAQERFRNILTKNCPFLSGNRLHVAARNEASRKPIVCAILANVSTYNCESPRELWSTESAYVSY
eukprot:1767-Heterococcus_DN1.PRE.2